MGSVKVVSLNSVSVAPLNKSDLILIPNPDIFGGDGFELGTSSIISSMLLVSSLISTVSLGSKVAGVATGFQTGHLFAK